MLRLALLDRVQHGEPDRDQDPGHEQAPELLLLLLHADPVAAEQLLQQLARVVQAGLAQLRGQRRQDHPLDHRLQDVVAGDLEALAEVLGRQDRAVVLGTVGGDDQVGGAAADVDARDPEARLRRRSRRRRLGRIVDERPLLAQQPEELGQLARELLGDLGVEIDQMGAAGLVPADHHAGLREARRRLAAPAEQVPDQADRALGARAHQALLLERRRRRQGDDDPLEAPGHVRLLAALAQPGLIDQAERLDHDLADHEAVERGAREPGADRALLAVAAPAPEPGLLLGLELADHVAGLVDEPAGGARDARVLAGAGIVARLEAPFLIDRVDRPEVALGARHAGRDLGAGGRPRDPDRLRPDPDQARPEEAARAPRPPGDVLLAEARLGELDPALERIGVDQLRPAEVAQLEHVAVVEVELGLVRIGLDQDAAGPAVADVQHQVDVDRRVAALGRDRVEQLEPRRRERVVEQLEERQIARPVLVAVGEILLAQRPPGTLGLLELAEQLQEPVVDPLLRVLAAERLGLRPGEEPAHLLGPPGEAELLLVLGVLERGHQIGAVGNPLRDVGIERQDDAVAQRPRPFGRIERGHQRARPVGRPGVEQLLAIGAAPGPDAQIGHRHPLVEEWLERLDLVDVVVLLLGIAGGKDRRILLVIARERNEAQPDRAVVQGHGPVGALDEAPAKPLGLLEIEAEIQELDAAVGHQGDRLLPFGQRLQHHL